LARDSARFREALRTGISGPAHPDKNSGCAGTKKSCAPESGSIFAEYKSQTEKAEARSIQYSELIKRSLEDINSEGGRILLQIKKNVRSSIDALRAAAQKNGIPMNDEMAISGGQAKNAQWMQAKAEGAGIGISVCNIADAELLGNAVTAQTALGRYDSITDAANALVKITKTYMPDKSSDRMKIYKIMLFNYYFFPNLILYYRA